MTAAPTPRPPRARLPLSMWVVAVAVPLVVGATAVALQLAWLSQLPNPIAVHWGTSGPDGYGAAWTAPVLSAALSLGLTAMFAAFLATARQPAPTASHKFLAVLSSVTAVFLGGTITASLALQRGLSDARDAPGIEAPMGVALAAALLLGILFWFALPKGVSAYAPAAAPTPALSLTPGERGVWIATTRVPTGLAVAIIGLFGITIALAVFLIAFSEGRAWALVFAPILIATAAAVAVSWRVRVDAGGLLVRSLPLGWPRVRIRPDEIERVQTPHVEPLSEFGGWGWRWAPARAFGVVTRSGPAIDVLRRDGRRFVVTVDDAETGAALLAAYAEASR